MSASPVPINEQKKAPEGLPQELIDAVVDFISDRASGCLEVHFSRGGVAKVIATRTTQYK